MCQNGLAAAVAMFKNTIAAVADVLVTSMFLYANSASVGEPWLAPIMGGLIVIVVPLSTEITRNVLSCPVASLVMWWTASMPATVKQSPATTLVVADTVTVW